MCIRYVKLIVLWSSSISKGAEIPCRLNVTTVRTFEQVYLKLPRSWAVKCALYLARVRPKSLGLTSWTSVTSGSGRQCREVRIGQTPRYLREIKHCKFYCFWVVDKKTCSILRRHILLIVPPRTRTLRFSKAKKSNDASTVYDICWPFPADMHMGSTFTKWLPARNFEMTFSRQA